MNVALYARVSTDDKDQDPETQLHALRAFCKDAGFQVAGEYIDKARARDWNRRTGWDDLQRDGRMRRFKTVLVFRLDRAFRSVRECLNCLEEWDRAGIAFKSLREGAIDTTTSQGRFMLQVMAAMAELESSIIGERVAAGIARVQAQGKHWGRPALDIPLARVRQAVKKSGSIRAASKTLGCSRAYIQAKLKPSPDTKPASAPQKRQRRALKNGP